MADLAKYVVALEAETARYERKLDQANKKLDRFERNQRQKLDLIKKGLLSLAGAFSIAAVTRFASNQIDAADALLDTTKRIGGTVEALSELEYVAKLNGVRFESFTMGLQRMTRRLAEAAKGTGEAVGALGELGLDAERLAKLPLDQQFEEVADALSKVGNQSDKTRLAMKLFDSEGVALLQTMEDGAAGIRNLRQEARELGKTLTTEQAEAASAANDALDRLNTSVTSLARNMVLELVPAINAVATGWNAMLFNASPFPFEKQIEDARDQLEELRKRQQMPDLAGTGDLGPFSEKLKMQIAEVEARIDSLIEKQREAFNPKASGSGAEISPIVVAEPNREALNELIADGRKQVDDLWRHFADRYATAEQEVAAEMKRFNMVDHLFPADEQARIREAIREPLLDGLEAIQIDVESPEEFSARMSGFFDDWVADAEAATSEMSEFAKEAARNIQDAFAEFLFDPFEDGLDGLLKGFVDVIRQMVANLAASEFLGLLGGLGGGVGKFFQLAGRASGGPVTAGTPYMVGERGPELFVPSASGRIMPNGAGASVHVEQHNVINGSNIDPPKMVAILEENNRKLEADIIDKIGRGTYG